MNAQGQEGGGEQTKSGRRVNVKRVVQVGGGRLPPGTAATGSRFTRMLLCPVNHANGRRRSPTSAVMNGRTKRVVVAFNGQAFAVGIPCRSQNSSRSTVSSLTANRSANIVQRQQAEIRHMVGARLWHGAAAFGVATLSRREGGEAGVDTNGRNGDNGGGSAWSAAR